MKVSVGIKALNEEANIERAIQSALAAVKSLDGEVVLADSGSSDQTIAIALKYDIRIVQLADPQMKSCGAGAQLAYQAARGTYFYLMDGDMALSAEFLQLGIEFLEKNPDVAGVGGRVVERATDSQEFQIRASSVAAQANWKAGEVDRLDCGGLYRMSAIESLGYFADSNLHAFEEFELAARLKSAGWKLARIDAHAVDHFGHRLDGYKLLKRRIRSGYSGGAGEVLRGAVGKKHLSVILRRFGHVRAGLAVMGWWLCILFIIALALTNSPAWLMLLFLILIVPLAYLTFRRGSLELGLYSLTAWNVSAAGLITGFFRSRRPPETELPLVELK